MPVIAAAPAAAAAVVASCAAGFILLTVTTAMRAAGCVIAHAAADGAGLSSVVIVADAAAGARIMAVSCRSCHDRSKALRWYVPSLTLMLAGAPSPSRCSKQAALLWATMVMLLVASITTIMGTAVLFRPHPSQNLQPDGTNITDNASKHSQPSGEK
jgi:hypothetical protein